MARETARRSVLACGNEDRPRADGRAAAPATVQLEVLLPERTALLLNQDWVRFFARNGSQGRGRSLCRRMVQALKIVFTARHRD